MVQDALYADFMFIRITFQNHVMKLHYGINVYDTKSFGEMRTERDTNKKVMDDLDLLSTKTSELKAQGNQIGAYQSFKQAVFRGPLAFAKSFIADLSNPNGREKFIEMGSAEIGFCFVNSVPKIFAELRNFPNTVATILMHLGWGDRHITICNA